MYHECIPQIWLFNSIFSQLSDIFRKSCFQVSVIKIDDATILYQKQLECRVSGGISSLQFELYSHNGYDKDLLIVGMEDSSISVLEEETGKLLNTNPVQTNRPSRALLLQKLGELYDLNPHFGVSSSHRHFFEDNIAMLLYHSKAT
jgi:hypothetical protein